MINFRNNTKQKGGGGISIVALKRGVGDNRGDVRIPKVCSLTCFYNWK